MIAAFESGNLAEARRWHHKLFPLCRDMLGLSTNPIPVKAAMRMLGRDTGESAPAADPVYRRRRSQTARRAGAIRIVGTVTPRRRLSCAKLATAAGDYLRRRPRRPRAGGTHDWPLPARALTVVPAGPVPVERMIGHYA